MDLSRSEQVRCIAARARFDCGREAAAFRSGSVFPWGKSLKAVAAATGLRFAQAQTMTCPKWAGSVCGSLPTAVLSPSFRLPKAACGKKGPTHLRPSRRWQTTKHRSNPVALGQGYMVKVQGAYKWHTIIRGQDNFGSYCANRARHRHDDDFI